MEEIFWLYVTLVIFSAVIRAEKEASYSINQAKEQHQAGEFLQKVMKLVVQTPSKVDILFTACFIRFNVYGFSFLLSFLGDY